MRLWLVFVCMLLFYAECRGGNDFTNRRASADFKQPPFHLRSGVEGVLQSNGDFIFAVTDPVNRKMIRTTNSGVTIKIGYLPVRTTTWTNSNSWINMPKGFYQLNDFKAFKDDTTHQTAFANFWQPPYQLGTDVKGVCLPNGDFIFQVYDTVYRKMIQTTNLGVTVKIGYLPVKSETWANSDSWINMPDGFYQVRGFQEKAMNLAVGKQATQSEYYLHYVPATYAVDGNTGTNYNNDKCTATSHSGTTRWWMVDLEKPSSIEKVTLFNRMDCCSERLNNAEVYVMDSPTGINKRECGRVVNAQNKAKIDIPCTSGELHGRYVRVEIPSGVLTLCEVQVWGKEQSCAPQQIVLSEPKSMTSEEASTRMRTSFEALQKNGGPSNLVSRWELEKSACFADGRCKNDFNENTVNINRVAYGLEAADDIAAGLTYMKSEAKLKHTLLGLVGKIGPYLSAMGAAASIISSFGTSPEMQKLNQIINLVGEGFNRMEDRFDKLETGIEQLGSEMTKGFFEKNVVPELKALSAANKDVKTYLREENAAERRNLAAAFTRDGHVTKLRLSINALMDVILGEVTINDACTDLIKAFAGDRRQIVDRLVRIFTRVLKGVTDLKVIMDATKQNDTQTRMDELEVDMEEIAVEIMKCDERLEGEWVGRWKQDMNNKIAPLKHTVSQEKELADAIYNELSGKYYWRHWLVYVYERLTDNKDYDHRLQADHSAVIEEGNYNILVTSIPEDAPIRTWTQNIPAMKRDLKIRGNSGYFLALGAKEILDLLPAAWSYPMAVVTREGWLNNDHSHFGIRAPKARKFHQHYTSVCHHHQCGTEWLIKDNPLWQTRRYQIVILG